MYSAHFNFREAPFSVTPDPQFYYLNAVYREAWAALHDGIQDRKGFILISGEAGTGKTTLLKKALQSFASNITTAYVYNPSVDYTQLLRFILADLGLPNTEKSSEMTARLQEYLVEQFKMGNIVALLIDEAQNLSMPTLEELRLIGDLEIDKKKLVQIVLVGQPELEEKLERAELRKLRQIVMVRCRLGPVASDEVEPYIDARLHNIGHNSRDLFTPEAIKKIALYSNGIPRLINNICDNALLIAYAESKFQVSAAMVDEVAGNLLIKRSADEAEAPSPATELATGGNKPLESSPVRDDALALNQKPSQSDSGSSVALNLADVSSGPNKRHLSAPAGILSIVVLAVLSGLIYSQRATISKLFSKSLVTAPAEQVNSQDSKPADAQQSKTIAASSQITTAIVMPLPAALRSDQSAPSQPDDHAAAKRTDPPLQQASASPAADAGKKSDAQSRGAGKEPASIGENYLVAAASFVRNNPASNADVIATLAPGTRINVTRYSGDYFRVRSLGDERIHGYVHREDAFFERIR